jgi:hypothetical protein
MTELLHAAKAIATISAMASVSFVFMGIFSLVGLYAGCEKNNAVRWLIVCEGYKVP